MKLKDDIQKKVRTEMDQQQREYYLNNQLRTIQEELGMDEAQDIDELRQKAKKKKWPEYAAKAFESEVRKLERSNPNSPDYNIQYQYIQFILDLPWDETTKDNLDLKHAQKVLDKDHYGLETVKERIIEYLAVLKLKGDMKSPIICLYGPPGVGKTSLGKSIAKALGRKYQRISLGGLHDESEIRGTQKDLHRSHAWPYTPEHQPGRKFQPGNSPRRDRQGESGLQGRSLIRTAGSAGPGAEQCFPRQLP